VKLSTLLGLWEAAGELALAVGLPLAKRVAHMPDEPETQRQLWLNIGNYCTTQRTQTNLVEFHNTLSNYMIHLVEIHDMLGRISWHTWSNFITHFVEFYDTVEFHAILSRIL
jgi:hypothetical protein